MSECIDLPETLKNFNGNLVLNCCCCCKNGKNNSANNDDSADSCNNVGEVTYFAMQQTPAGWLKCDGTAVSRTEFKRLFAAIGTTFGEGDGETTFNLPELRGEFIRGFDSDRGIDADRSFGSWQKGTLQPYDPNQPEVWTLGLYNNIDSDPETIIKGAGLEQVNAEDYAPYCLSGTCSSTVAITDLGIPRAKQCLASVRPRNVNLLACIKY